MNPLADFLCVEKYVESVEKGMEKYGKKRGLKIWNVEGEGCIYGAKAKANIGAGMFPPLIRMVFHTYV